MTDAGHPARPLRVSAQIHVAADPHEVWRLMTDWSRQHEWIWATRVHSRWRGQSMATCHTRSGSASTVTRAAIRIGVGMAPGY